MYVFATFLWGWVGPGSRPWEDLEYSYSYGPLYSTSTALNALEVKLVCLRLAQIVSFNF